MIFNASHQCRLAITYLLHKAIKIKDFQLDSPLLDCCIHIHKDIRSLTSISNNIITLRESRLLLTILIRNKIISVIIKTYQYIHIHISISIISNKLELRMMVIISKSEQQITLRLRVQRQVIITKSEDIINIKILILKYNHIGMHNNKTSILLHKDKLCRIISGIKTICVKVKMNKLQVPLKRTLK